MTSTIDLDSRRPHVTVKVVCTGCSHSWIAVAPECTDLSVLECPKCGAQDSEVSQ